MYLNGIITCNNKNHAILRSSLNKRNKGNNPIYFSEMLTYMDKVVGRISDALKQLSLIHI